MGCQMPVMDGYEVTGTMRGRISAVRDHNIPIIVMTANAMKGDWEKCIEAGMNGYISKPVDLEKLADTVGLYFHNGSREHQSS